MLIVSFFMIQLTFITSCAKGLTLVQTNIGRKFILGYT